MKRLTFVVLIALSLAAEPAASGQAPTTSGGCPKTQNSRSSGSSALHS